MKCKNEGCNNEAQIGTFCIECYTDKIDEIIEQTSTADDREIVLNEFRHNIGYNVEERFEMPLVHEDSLIGRIHKRLDLIEERLDKIERQLSELNCRTSGLVTIGGAKIGEYNIPEVNMTEEQILQIKNAVEKINEEKENNKHEDRGNCN